MKKFLGATIGLTAIFLLSLSSFQASAAPLGRWVRIITLPLPRDGNRGVYLVDKASIERRGNTRSYWLGLVFDKPVKVNDRGKNFSIGKLVAYTSINCSNRSKYQVDTIGIFDPKDKLITTVDFKNGIVSLPAQGTKVTGNYVCSRK